VYRAIAPACPPSADQISDCLNKAGLQIAAKLGGCMTAAGVAVAFATAATAPVGGVGGPVVSPAVLAGLAGCEAWASVSYAIDAYYCRKLCQRDQVCNVSTVDAVRSDRVSAEHTAQTSHRIPTSVAHVTSDARPAHNVSTGDARVRPVRLSVLAFAAIRTALEIQVFDPNTCECTIVPFQSDPCNCGAVWNSCANPANCPTLLNPGTPTGPVRHCKCVRGQCVPCKPGEPGPDCYDASGKYIGSGPPATPRAPLLLSGVADATTNSKRDAIAPCAGGRKPPVHAAGIKCLLR
jgi:hypothetical protein